MPHVMVRVRSFWTLLWSDRTALALAALAVTVYLPALWWGLPVATSEAGIRGWDVDGVTGISVLAEFHNLLVEAKSDWYVAYPLFHYVVLGIFYAPYLAWLMVTGGLTPESAYPYGFSDPVTSLAVLAIIGRLVSMLMATGTVVAAYHAARIVWDRNTGFLTGLLVMLSGPMIYRARTGNLDVPVLFWTSLGVVVLALIATKGFSVKRAALLGVFAALSTATKDQAYGGWVAVIAMLMLMHWRALLPSPDQSNVSWWKSPAVLILVGLAVYAIANGIFLSPDRYLAHTQFILTYEEARFAFPELDLERAKSVAGFALLAYEIAAMVVFAVGPPVALAAIVGLLVPAGNNRFLWLLAAMLFGYVVLVIAPIAHVQYRYALLPGFLLAFPAAHWLVTMFRRRGFQAAVGGIVGTLAIGYLICVGGILTYQKLFDARYDAGRWLASHMKPGQKIGYFGDRGQLPRLPVGINVVQMLGEAGDKDKLTSGELAAVLVIPDYTAPESGERSLFMPKDTYLGLQNGDLPYGLAARFETPAPLGIRFPFVNSPVRIFVHETAERQ